MKHVPNIPPNILLIKVNQPIVTTDETNLKEILMNLDSRDIYIYSPYQKIIK